MIEYFPPIDNAKDYIRRGDLLFKSTFRDGIFDNSESTLQRLEHYYVSLRQVYEAPTADVKPVVHGKWIGEADGYADGELVYDAWYCSCCDYAADDDEKPSWNFCPNCGAKMGGGKDDV